MNQVILVGRLVYEPECKATTSGTVYMSNRIAVSRNDKDKTTDFINIQAWTKTAEFVQQYFRKGDPISISGKLQTRSYEKSDGTKKEETYVFATEVAFVPQKKTETAPVPATSDTELPAQPEKPRTAPEQLPFEI